MVLFSESNSEGITSKWLGKTCLGREQKIRELGLSFIMIPSGKVLRPIYLAILMVLHWWSLGNMQFRYIFAGSGGAQFIGHTACGLPLSDRTSSLLPPHH